jgi:hypothetical protein
MPLMEMKTTYYCSPLATPLVVSPEAVSPFIAPCQQKAVTEQTLLSLFLTAVRVVTKRGDLKDGLWEVKETLLLSRKLQSASERHLHSQAMHKKAIKPNLHPDPWDHQFPGPPAFPTM